MSLVIEYWNCLLIVARAINTNNASDWFIWLQEIAVLRDSAFMEERLRSWGLGAIVINNQGKARN